MASLGKPTTRRYSAELKARAVRMVRALREETGEQHGSVKRVADQLDIGVESLRTWVRRDEVDNGEAAGTTVASQRGCKKGHGRRFLEELATHQEVRP